MAGVMAPKDNVPCDFTMLRSVAESTPVYVHYYIQSAVPVIAPDIDIEITTCLGDANGESYGQGAE